MPDDASRNQRIANLRGRVRRLMKGGYYDKADAGGIAKLIENNVALVTVEWEVGQAELVANQMGLIDGYGPVQQPGTEPAV